MTFTINILRAWRFRHRKHGAQVLSPGVYYVPDQIEERYALLAIDQGMAVRMNPPVIPPVEAPQAVREIVLPVNAQSDYAPAKAPRKRGRPRKHQAPENKLLHVAENK